VWKWHDDFLCVLPDYRVLVIGSNRKQISRGKRKGLLTSETDTPDERAAKWSAFQAGLYDVVILSYDALARTKMNQEALLEYVKTVESLQRQVKLRQRNAAKKKAEDLSERDKAILKHGVRAFVEEMLELPEGHKFDPGIAWDDIGIDMLIVDEAAAFKNSYKPEAREHGLPKFMGSGGDGSKRAWQLDFRAAAVRQRTGGSGIVLLTATPAKNSPLEFYNLIQLIDPHAFSSRGLMDPEQFIDRFLRIESREIIDMTLKVSMRSVVDGFKNLDDLRTIIHRYGEFRSGVEVGLTLPEPRIEQVRVPLGPEQEDLYGELVRKLERTLQQSQIKGSSQNKILGLLARLSLVALHAKLDGGVEYGQALSSVSPADYASPKLTACAQRVAASTGCGHVIFCEPTAVHLWMREVLVAHGGAARAHRHPQRGRDPGGRPHPHRPRVQRHHRRAARAGFLRQRTQPAGAAEVRRDHRQLGRLRGHRPAGPQLRGASPRSDLDPRGPRAAQRPGRAPGQRAADRADLLLPVRSLDGLVSLHPDPGQARVARRRARQPGPRHQQPRRAAGPQ
jgi:hypothetical protein